LVPAAVNLSDYVTPPRPIQPAVGKRNEYQRKQGRKQTLVEKRVASLGHPIGYVSLLLLIA